MQNQPKHSVTLGIMTKYWVAGTVKTRLGNTIGMVKAAKLHRLFISKLCDSLSDAADQHYLCITPREYLPSAQRALDQWQLSREWRVVLQEPGDLGAKMSGWFQQTLGTNKNSSAILIGGDCPLLSKDDITQAANCLRQFDVVLGPACDGGYYLIGIAGPWRPELETIFQEIPWSTDEVLSITRQKLSHASQSMIELEPREDIDTERELTQLLQSQKQDQEMTEDEHADFFSAIKSILEESASSDWSNG
ncbi:MAG TPA: hypothetical protein DEF45_05950 [Rhodopirellula sp.]|nr:MAG: hypothetical protein CBD74_01070 [Saprospirales bacterium TMED214]HBV62548.1 hypothetical protein [Rhodopirellula sp.]